jgi:spermidine synthase
MAGVVRLAAGTLGGAAMIAQLVLMRELLAAFSGNELVFGLALGCWLLLTGIGTWVGRLAEPWCERNPRALARATVGGLVSAAVLPLAELAAIRVFRDRVFDPGAAVDAIGTAAASFVALAPFCIASGMLLTLLCALAARSTRAPIRRVYLADTLGGIAGGALLTAALAGRFSHVALLAVPAFVLLASAAGLAWCARGRGGVFAAAAGAAGLALVLATADIDAATTRRQYRGEIAERSQSPYARLVVVRHGGELTFFGNGVPLGSTDDVAAREEAAHYGLAQRDGPLRVLLVGGAATGTAGEVLRHPVSALTCVERDARMLAIARQSWPQALADPRVRAVIDDARSLLRTTPERYDVVILDLPDPATLQDNRFFTVEFFDEVKRVLADGGVLAFGLSHYENFISDDLARILACAHVTVRSAFAHVEMIGGGRVFFVASDGALRRDIARVLEARRIEGGLVNRSYLDAVQAADRAADLERAVARPAELNTDFNPVLPHLHLRHWLAQFGVPRTYLAAALLAGVAVYAAWLPPVPRVVFAAGFAAAGLELVVLLAWQVFFGALYRQVGLVVTVVMAGLAAGAAWVRAADGETSAGRRVVQLGFALAALASILPSAIELVRGVHDSVAPAAAQAALLGLALLVAMGVGAQFSLASESESGRVPRLASQLFGADLVGAAAGALAASAWLVPRYGLATTCGLIAALNAAAAALGWRATRRL